MPTAPSETIAPVSDLPHPAVSDPTAPVLSLVEWIASDPESGVLRLRGEFPDPARTYSVAPVLVLRDESGAQTQRPALNEDRPSAGGWRAAYLVAGALLGGAREKWLEWPDGTRLALPDVDVSAGDGRTPAPPPERGAEVFDRAVLAERRARRAESAQRAQTRAAEAAVAALGALERRVEELTRERDALTEAQSLSAPSDDAARPTVSLVELSPPVAPSGADADVESELEAARAAQREAESSERRLRQALDDALKALARLRIQAAEVRLRMRTQLASASADAVRLAVLETERRGYRSRLQELRVELDALRSRVAREQTLAEALAEELEAVRAGARRAETERDGLRDALAEERRARARVDGELGSQRTAAQAGAARIAELEAALAGERARVDQASEALAQRVEALGEQLRGERSTRASLAMQLRVVRASESAARAEAAARSAAHATLCREHAEAVADAAAARRELAAVREESARASRTYATAPTPDARLVKLETELGATRAALEAAGERLRHAAVVEAAGGEQAPAPAPDGQAARGDETPRPAVSPEVAEQLRRRIAVLQEAAARSGGQPAVGAAEAPAPATPSPDRVAARLDAAAASLRAAAVESPSPRPLDGRPAAEPLPPHEPVPSAAAREPLAPAIASSLALTVHAAPEVVPAEPSHGDVTVGGDVAADPALRAALVRLAGEDPFTAARLLAELLPAQGAFLREDVDYDLTIRELGTFAITVAAGRTSVRLLARPRPRREAEMHLTVHALTLAELLAGRSRRVGRLLSPVKLRGSRRALEVLAALAQAGPSLAEVARAGAVLDPELLVRVLPHIFGPADTEGHSFTVAVEVAGETTRAWYLTADGRRGLTVATSPPEGGADARVTMSRATFDRLLRAEAPDAERKPWVRGDFTAVEILRRWIDAARG
jgi:hypothetical protein